MLKNINKKVSYKQYKRPLLYSMPLVTSPLHLINFICCWCMCAMCSAATVWQELLAAVDQLSSSGRQEGEHHRGKGFIIKLHATLGNR
jgi:hypothetical protein